MVIFDMHEVNLSTFGAPLIEDISVEGDKTSAVILDVRVAPDFNLKTCPYIFFRFSDCIKYLNLDIAVNGEYKFSTLMKTYLVPQLMLYPAGSLLAIQNIDDPQGK